MKLHDIFRPLSITVPLLPSSLNKWSREHWTTRNKERKKWVAAMEPRLLLAGCRKDRPIWAGPVEISLVYHVKGKRSADADNMAPKHAIDALKGWVVPDDAPSYVPRLVQSVVMGAASDHTVITVTPLEKPALDPGRPYKLPAPYVSVMVVDEAGGQATAGRKRRERRL